MSPSACFMYNARRLVLSGSFLLKSGHAGHAFINEMNGRGETQNTMAHCGIGLNSWLPLDFNVLLHQRSITFTAT